MAEEQEEDGQIPVGTAVQRILKRIHGEEEWTPEQEKEMYRATAPTLRHKWTQGYRQGQKELSRDWETRARVAEARMKSFQAGVFTMTVIAIFLIVLSNLFR